MSDNNYTVGEGSSRRRGERAHVHNRLKGVFLKCELLGKPEIRIVNISDTGIGIESVYLTPAARSAKTLSGKLVVGKTVAPVTLRLARVGNDSCGFEFMNLNNILKGAIRLYFEAELVGASLKPITMPKDVDAEQPRILEYKDDNANSLRIEVGQEKINKFSINVLGNEIEWASGCSPSLVQGTKSHSIGTFLRKQVIQFIRSADTIEPPYRKQMETILMGVV